MKYPIDVEYALSRELEAEYRKRIIKKLGRLRFGKDPKTMLRLCHDICELFGVVKIRRIETFTERKHIAGGIYAVGCYRKQHVQPGKRSGVIIMESWADQITLIHELAHHFVAVERLDPSLKGRSESHARDFLWAEKLIFEAILNDEL